jgi:uncharacterized protein
MVEARRIRIVAGPVSLEAELKSNKTAEAVYAALPIETAFNTWGEEFYFSIPVDAEPEGAVEQVSVGDLAYWPQGRAFCIFFGKTPMSRNEEVIIPASAVNPLGRIEGVKRLKKHKDGERIRISLPG